MLAFPFTYILPSVIFIVMFNKSILVHISRIPEMSSWLD